MTTTTTEVLKTDCLGRVKVSADYREAVLDEFEASALSGKAFAQKYGIKYPTFASWIQKRRRERGDYLDSSEANGSQSTQDPIASTALTLAEVVVSGSATPTSEDNDEPPGNPSPPPLSLSVGADLHIECSQRSQIPLLLELLEALNSAKSC
jgi:hypothetical protein